MKLQIKEFEFNKITNASTYQQNMFIKYLYKIQDKYNFFVVEENVIITFIR